MPLVIKEYSFLTPDYYKSSAYRALCKVANLRPVSDGYGLAHCVDDETGDHWTALTYDVDWLRMWIEAGRPSTAVNEEGIERPSREYDWTLDNDVLNKKFALRRAGWPDEWL